jgi:hypothetical protein
MSAIADVMLDSFDLNTKIIWCTEGLGTALASFATDKEITRVRFVEVSNGHWQVNSDYRSNQSLVTQHVHDSVRILGGAFQAVHEFLEVRQPRSLVFAGEHEALQELYETYLKRQYTPLARLGYYVDVPLGSRSGLVIERRLLPPRASEALVTDVRQSAAKLNL